MADPAARIRACPTPPEGRDPQAGRRRLGQAGQGLGVQRRGAGRHRVPGDPPRRDRRRVVSRRATGSPTYNIYSSSKAYTSTAFGLILSDFGGRTPSAGQAAHARHQGLQRRVAPRVAPAARPAEGRRHRPELPEHGLRPRAPRPSRRRGRSRSRSATSRARRSRSSRAIPGRSSTTATPGVAHLVLVFHQRDRDRPLSRSSRSGCSTRSG